MYKMRIATSVEYTGNHTVTCGETNELITRLESQGHKILDVAPSIKLNDTHILFTIKYE